MIHLSRIARLIAVLAVLLPSMAHALAWRAAALDMFPPAQSIGEMAGNPPAAALLANGNVLGYAFLTSQIAPIRAYSGQPVTTLVIIDLQGVIRAVRILEHSEPILVVGVDNQQLERYAAQYVGKQATDVVRVGGDSRPGFPAIDGITGATITTMVINASIMKAARAVHASRRDSRDSPIKPAATTLPTSDPGITVGAERSAIEWQPIWRARAVELAGLGAGIILLTLILILQDWLARYPRMLQRVRLVFLVYTVVFIGWIGLAQLSVLNVFTFLHALLGGFTWETFLIEPLTFVLWAYVALTLLLWGRGVYCGWLCPFGAMQELINRLGQRLLLPQWQIPELIHERLLAIKYLFLVGLFGLSLHALELSFSLAEVEPFKTALVLHFDRAWPFVVYAAAMLAIAAFNGKFYCKYLCPLGAALAVPSKLRIFDWLRRRPECAHPCQSCAKSCPSQAIRPTGEINVNECHYCLDCQMTYWDEHRCPPLVERRKRRERRAARTQTVEPPAPS